MLWYVPSAQLISKGRSNKKQQNFIYPFYLILWKMIYARTWVCLCADKYVCICMYVCKYIVVVCVCVVFQCYIQGYLSCTSLILSIYSHVWLDSTLDLRQEIIANSTDRVLTSRRPQWQILWSLTMSHPQLLHNPHMFTETMEASTAELTSSRCQRHRMSGGVQSRGYGFQ